MTTNDLADPIEAIPVETTGAGPLMSGLAWVAVVVAVVLIGWWVWTRWVDPPVAGTIDRYVHQDAGSVFADPNVAQFRVTTPTKWKVDSLANSLGTIVRVTDTPGDYEFSVTKTPQPLTALDSYVQGLNRLTGQLASDDGAEIIYQSTPFPLGDVVFKRFVFRKGDTYWRGQFDLLKDRLYTLIVQAPNSDDRALPAHGEDLPDPRTALSRPTGPRRLAQLALTSSASNSLRRCWNSSTVIA